MTNECHGTCAPRYMRGTFPFSGDVRSSPLTTHLLITSRKKLKFKKNINYFLIARLKIPYPLYARYLCSIDACIQDTLSSRAREQRYLAYKIDTLGLKAEMQPAGQAWRVTIGYLVYNLTPRWVMINHSTLDHHVTNFNMFSSWL